MLESRWPESTSLDHYESPMLPVREKILFIPRISRCIEKSVNKRTIETKGIFNGQI